MGNNYVWQYHHVSPVVVFVGGYLRPPAQKSHFLPMNGIGPCPSEILDHVLYILAIDLLEEDDIGAGPGVQDKPDLGIRCWAKNFQDQFVQWWTAQCFSAPQTMQPVSGVFQGWADYQNVDNITLYSLTSLSKAITIPVGCLKPAQHFCSVPSTSHPCQYGTFGTFIAITSCAGPHWMRSF